MIDTVYLDMDGVLVDFLGRCWDKQVFDERGRIDWGACVEIGPDFWATMEWLPGSKEFLNIILRECNERNIECGILSAIDVKYGELGKRLWCKWNTSIDNDHVIIVPHGAPSAKHPGTVDKSWYAKPGRLLIDDNVDNITAFRNRGGDGILYENPEQAMTEFMEKIMAD